MEMVELGGDIVWDATRGIIEIVFKYVKAHVSAESELGKLLSEQRIQRYQRYDVWSFDSMSLAGYEMLNSLVIELQSNADRELLGVFRPGGRETFELQASRLRELLAQRIKQFESRSSG